MAKMKVDAIEYTCDDCGAIQIVTPDAEVMGLEGVVSEVTSTYGVGGVEWFACKRAHVAKAVAKALDRAFD